MKNIVCVSLIVLSALIFFGCEKKEEKVGLEKPTYKQTSFSDLNGWDNDQQRKALFAFVKSCPGLQKKGLPLLEKYFAKQQGADLSALCQQADSALQMSNENAAKDFFEKNFTPYLMKAKDGAEGLFTGYFEIVLKGSSVQTPEFPIPIYQRPQDLLTIQLKDFPTTPEDVKTLTLFGRVQGNQVKAYPARDVIESGLLKDQNLELAWLKDKVDLLYLQIQGSGIIELENGEKIRVGYTAKNGYPYGSVGKELVARGQMTADQASMESIRTWFAAHPDQVDDILKANPSYIFFRPILGDGPIGAAGVALTPERALAVDTRYYDMGLPLWLETQGANKDKHLNQLMIAQDTGSAITGIVRGDFFWGTGEAAGKQAGSMKDKGQFYLLVPSFYHLKKDGK